MKLSLAVENWKLKKPFRIASREMRDTQALLVTLEDEGSVGRGEAEGVFYLGETAESMFEQIESVSADLENGVSRASLQKLLPPGGARNALDCALWDLEAKKSGKSIWELTGISPKPVITVFTIGIEASAQDMAEKAAAAASYPVLKIKLDDESPIERLRAIRAARPDATLVVDANQGWTFDLLRDVVAANDDIGLSMIEQPLPRGADEALSGFESPVTLAADESCLHIGELEVVCSRYDMINIKLDKTGGLTEALALAYAAREGGFEVMVGNMLGTSLSMAPSFVVAQLCDFVDIDGPLLLESDREFGLAYEAGLVSVFDSRLWG